MRRTLILNQWTKGWKRKIFKCQTCGKEYNRPPSNKGKFCSRKCYFPIISINNSKRAKKLNCLNCGKEIPFYQKYCSKKCYFDYKVKFPKIKRIKEIKKIPCACGCGNLINEKDKLGRKRYYIKGHGKERKKFNTIKCQTCGKEFKAWDNRNRMFCSKKCYAPYLSKIAKGRIISEKSKRLMSLAAIHRKIPPKFKNTSIEVAMQKTLKERGITFETHKKIFGRPDIFIEPNICIFCDGDYWHGNPKVFSAFNDRQLRGIKRDLEVNNFLRNDYKILRYWESEIKDNVEGCIDEIEDVLFLGGTT